MAVDITFGGKTTIREGSNFFNLELGTAPSRGIVTMYGSDLEALNPENTGFTFKIVDDDQRTIEVKNLYVTKGEVLATNVRELPSDAPDTVLAVHLEDPRSLFQWKDITGQYNVLKEDGITYRPNTVNGATPLTFDEVLQKVFDALDIDLTANTGLSYIPQNVTWDAGSSAAAALEALLGEVGWALAWKPDDSYELIDLNDPPQSFTVGGDFTVVSQTKEAYDVAHDKPAVARMAFRVMRKKEEIFSPVLKHDGKAGANGRSTSIANNGEWADASAVLSDWGSSLSEAKRMYYKWASQGKAYLEGVKKLGGGSIGAERMRRIRSQLYKVFRLSGTDRGKILPLLPLVPEFQTAPGFEAWQGVEPSTGTKFHIPSRSNSGVKSAPGIPNRDLIINENGQPGFGIKIVSKVDGVIAFDTPGPLLPPISGINKVGNGFLPQDFELTGDTLRIGIGYVKKFSNANDPEADYFFVERTTEAPNNGETKTFRAAQAWYLEVFDSGSGGFSALNESELQASAEAALDGYLRGFNLPPEEKIHVEGIHTQHALTQDVRAIQWDASDGASTTFMLYTRRSVNPFDAPPGVRGTSFALQAQSATLWNPSNLNSGGGSGGGGDVGSLDNVSPSLKDHGTGERTPVTAQGWTMDFLTSQGLGLLVASDLSMGKSGADPCEGETKTTPSGKSTLTGRQGEPGVASNPTGGGTQVTGGGLNRSSGGGAGG